VSCAGDVLQDLFANVSFEPLTFVVDISHNRFISTFPVSYPSSQTCFLMALTVTGNLGISGSIPEWVFSECR
jgi:hypothetical protein